MIETVTKWLESVPGARLKEILRAVVNPVADRYSTQSVRTAGLVITATSGKKVPKIGAADYYAVVQGVIVLKAAGTDMPALSGNVTNAKFNVYCFFIDSAGTMTSARGTEGATLAAVKWPPFPAGKALIGFIIINPTGTGDFVGDTTALDDGTVAPNTVYVSHNGPFDPSVVL